MAEDEQNGKYQCGLLLSVCDCLAICPEFLLNCVCLCVCVKEREYREAILRDVSQAPRLSPAKTKAQHKTQRNTQTTPGRRKETPRKAPPSKLRLVLKGPNGKS